MKIKRSILLMICAAALSMTACSGNGANVPASTPAETTEATTAAPQPSEIVCIPSAENVKLLGRAALTDDMLWLTFSGSGAEFEFNGTKAEITVSGDDTALSNAPDSQARIAVYVNGERVVDDMIDAETETYTVFESDEPADCRIKVVKLSESANSTCALKSVTVTGFEGIKPADKKAHFIEFVGDSITCGYGVDDEDRDHHFSTATEDVTKTYAYKTAEKLDADYSMVSASGFGIISGYSDGKKKVEAQQLPKYYDKTGISYGAKWNGKNASSESWDFSGYTPDAVVINLGTNDYSYTKNDGDKCEEYAAAYIDFIKDIRSHHPDAHIFCTLGIMGGNLFPYIEYAAEMYKEETGDENISIMLFDTQDSQDGYAADWHPTEKTHEKAAEKLAAEIKSVMGW